MSTKSPAPAPLDPRISPLQSSPDRGDGTYQNPVLFADYSDPDAIRVGDDYWLTASSFSHVPGLPILHSRDLVNWKLVNHALRRLVPSDHFAAPRHGAGVWAPALRHHGGRYSIYYPDPDFGIYVVTALDPRGEWSAPVMVKAGKGLIDPCPFWDDDGSAYLVHGWAKSRSGIKNRVTLHQLSAEGTQVLDPGEIIIDGDAIEGWHTIEGPKLYKRNGYYYLFAPAGGVRDGYQAVFRSRTLRGPYERRITLAQGATVVNGPHQGAWVDTPTGEHWFLHFQEQPAFGRVVHLQPMTWRDDWPLMGRNQNADGTGEPVDVYPKPATRAHADRADRNGIRVDPTVPGIAWQWQANPGRDWFSLAPGAVWRLPCVATAAAANLWTAGHLLLRKLTGPACSLAASLTLRATADGTCAGLVVFGHDYAWVGLRRDHGTLRLVLRICEKAHEGAAEVEVASLDASVETVNVGVAIDSAARCQFFAGIGDAALQPIGPRVQAKSSYWVGAKVGFFAQAAGSSAPAGECRAELAGVKWTGAAI